MADKPSPLRSGRINCNESSIVISSISLTSRGMANLAGLEDSFLNTYKKVGILNNILTAVEEKVY